MLSLQDVHVHIGKLHILQGVSRHSPTGVMKPRWDRDDYSQMAWRPLPFTEADIVLIRLGMKARASPSALVSATLVPQSRER